MDPWKIVLRIRGHLDTMEPGQTEWSPVWGSRRLADGARFRLEHASEAHVNLADGTKFIITNNFNRPAIYEVSYFKMPPGAKAKLFHLRSEKVMDDVSTSLGFSKHRFDPARSSGGPMAPRG